jgi:hypothetical protein
VARVREQSVGRVVSPFLGIASVVTAATAFGYTRQLEQQGSWPAIDGRVALVLGLLPGSTILAGIGTFTRSRALHAYVAATCAAVLLPLGFLALFSIGLPLMAAGALAFATWITETRGVLSHRERVASVGAAIAALVVLAIGLISTASGS